MKAEQLFNYTNDVSDPEKFKTWVPKIEAYRKKLDLATPAELKTTSAPQDLDAVFNAVKFLKDEKILDPQELEITELSATDLAESIRIGKYSCVTVLKAYAKRAVVGHQLTNFAMEFFIDEGLQRAQELDDFFQKTGKLAGPLHGVPISLKEQIGVANKITHGGWVGMLDNLTKEDAVTVKVLRSLGAVFYVRTNQPQSLMHLDSNNNITGRTRNPYNLKLTAGGSSGGEGAATGFGASALSVGTDIGGSVRGPAAFCGVYGLRPSTRRISCLGGVSSGKGQESVVAIAGPLARDINDIDLFMDSYINKGSPSDFDPWCIPIPWRSVSVPKPQDVKVAVMWDDGIVKPAPPIARGLRHVVDKLMKAGVEVVDFEPIRMAEAYTTVNEMYSCDGNYAQKELIRKSGEPLLHLTEWAFSFGSGDKELSITENRELNYVRDSIRKDYLDYMVENKVDFILSPNYFNVAPVGSDNGVGGAYYWGYTALFNLLDMPNLTFPTGLYQDPEIDVKESASSRSDIEELEHGTYNEADFKDAPIGLQLTGRRYHDEEVVAAGKLIKDLLGLAH